MLRWVGGVVFMAELGSEIAPGQSPQTSLLPAGTGAGLRCTSHEKQSALQAANQAQNSAVCPIKLMAGRKPGRKQLQYSYNFRPKRLTKT